MYKIIYSPKAESVPTAILSNFSFKSDHLSELQEIVIWPDAHFLGIADKWQDVCLYLIDIGRMGTGTCPHGYTTVASLEMSDEPVKSLLEGVD